MANAKPLVLNNGTFLQSTEYSQYSHLDKAHALHQNQGKEHVTDLGLLEPYVTSGYLTKPLLWDFTKMKMNRKYVDGHIFKYSHPIEDEPCYIIEDISGSDKPGIDNEKFKIKTNSRRYGQGYVLAADFHSPHQMLVTSDEIVEDGDGFILTVTRRGVGQSSKYYPKELLRPGTKLFPVTTMHTEMSEVYSDIPTPSGGVREYMNTVGYTRAQLHYSVTREAAFSKMSSKVTAGLADYRKMIESYTFAKGSLGYAMSMSGGQNKNMLTAAYKQKYGKKSDGMLKEDIVKRSWIPEIELLGAAWLNNLVEQEAIWGTGGLIDFDGKTKAQSSIGYFQQLNMGNSHVYNIPGMTLQKLEFIIASRIKDKITPFSGNVITLKCGQGALQLVKNQLNKLPARSGMVMQANDYIEGIGAKNNQSLKWTNPNIDSWEMENGLGTIKFELAAGLDPIDANDFINPIVPLSNGAIGGHRLSSYMFIIDDITNGASDNVLELVYGADWDMTHSVHQGKLPYMGMANNSGSWQRGSNHPGFEVYMEKRHKAYFVKDVTKSLLIKPINPFTNKPIYESDLK